ncbi:vitamin K epoxide reductase family protein [uncultured Pontibacter sp.]|uniref:vitamin K epoxide reductase family protein n=1 Tax=uncultured Pontibacter sp. TaxID=453356 RepID=UPI002601AEA9|nr:vitamin K epoxide reductase family protein [uncultured Pontibacter sp.]
MKQETSIIDKIRDDSSEATQHRRDIATLAAIGLTNFSLISLFQMGKIKRLPDLPGKLFDTHQVNTAKDAVLLGLPDGVISLGGYAATMILAMAAIRYKKQARLLDVALGGVVLGQAAGAAQYMVNMTTVQKKACIYCIAGAVVNFAALKPLRSLFKRRE